MSAVDRYTLGQIRHAADLAGDPSLFWGALEGDDLAVETLARFPPRNPKRFMQPAERSERHRTLTL